MSIPHRPPDAEVLFELTASTFEGQIKSVASGYRPLYDVCSEFWTSSHHEFLDLSTVQTGQTSRANVWFLSSEHHSHSLWVGRALHVTEGSRIVGAATVLKVFNPLLVKSLPPAPWRPCCQQIFAAPVESTAVPTRRSQTAH